MGHFKNKTAIITGSATGIGKAIARELCRQGAKVVLNGRTAERLEKAKQELAEEGYDVIAVQGDVTLAGDCERLVNTALEKYGKIDILITNAGISMREHFENLQPELFGEIVHSNISGSAYPALLALPHIKKSKGSIVFISSVAGMFGLPTASAYSAGKMALTALAQSLKIELSHTGVHIGIVYVSFTKNDETKRVKKAGGELVPVAERPAWLQQTQQEVALAVLGNIRRRRFKTTLSFVGKLNAFAVKFFPSLVMRIVIISQRKMRKMYE